MHSWFTMQNVILIWVMVEKDIWKTLREGPALRSQGGAVACVPGRPYVPTPQSREQMELEFAFISSPPPACGPLPRRGPSCPAASVVAGQRGEGEEAGQAAEVCRQWLASTFLEGA